MAEIENITDVSATERIDTLRVISHHADIILRLCQTLDEHELDIVSVLVLIY